MCCSFGLELTVRMQFVFSASISFTLEGYTNSDGDDYDKHDADTNGDGKDTMLMIMIMKRMACWYS